MSVRPIASCKAVFFAKRLGHRGIVVARSDFSEALVDAPRISVAEAVKKLASRPTAPRKIRDLYEHGLSSHRSLQHSIFLHRELRTRLAGGITALESLPTTLRRNAGIRRVVDRYTNSIMDLENCPQPSTPELEHAFTDMLRLSFQQHGDVVHDVIFGVRRSIAGELGDQRAEVDATLERFFLAHVGVRFLAQQHLEALAQRSQQSRLFGRSGLLDRSCRPARLALQAGEDTVRLCQDVLGAAPKIQVIEERRQTLLHDPTILRYIFTEILKNAARAVVEQHAPGAALPVITCHVRGTQEEVVVSVSDEGGGMDPEQLSRVWQFLYTTCGTSPSKMLRDEPNEVSMRLAGHGVGLSRSRIYARYFGGELSLSSLPGRGTEARLHLGRSPFEGV